MDLQHNNLPDKGENKQHDIISWYNNSKIKNPKIKEIWVQAKVNKKYNPESGLIVSQNNFPKIKKISIFITRVIISFFVTIYGISIGRWWYGYLYRESISLHYTSLISSDILANDYYFHNSGWFFKPLWTYEVEKKGSNVILYFYSTNMKVFKFNEYNQDETYGLKIMSWKRFLVWDQFQEDYLKQFCPTASFVKIGYLNFSGMIYVKASNINKKILSVFDVTPTRKLKYMSLGYAIPPYYSEENNLRFLEDISQIINTKNWLLLWKPKRWVDSKFISNSFKKKQFLLTEKNFSKVNPDISANSLVKNSDIVISMPFSSIRDRYEYRQQSFWFYE